MKKVDLVFRSAGERTAKESLKLAIENIQPDNVYHLNNVGPFRVAVEKMLNIEHDAQYVIYVDADCLILEDMRPLLEVIDFDFVDCLVDDYFRGIVRAGVHITGIDLVKTMKEKIHSIERNRRFCLRPESAVRTPAMTQLNVTSTTKRLNILHDAYQSHQHIFAKYISREFRDRTDKYPALDDSMKSWGVGTDFEVARAAVHYARSNGVSKDTDHDLLQFLDQLSEVAAKQTRRMNLPSQDCFRLSYSERKKHRDRYNAHVLSKPKVFGIGLEKTKRLTLRKALDMLGIDSFRYSESKHQLEKLSRGELDMSLLDFYDGSVDLGIVPHYKELDEKFENARFILTVRKTKRWNNQIKAHWRRTAEKEEVGLGGQSKQKAIIREKVYGVTTYQSEELIRAYNRHYEDVINHFSDRPHKLLVMDIAGGDGWQKLCQFLEIPIPNTQFPYIRKRANLAEAAS